MPDVLKVRWLGQQTENLALAGRDVAPDCVFDLPGRLLDEAEHREALGLPAGAPFAPDHVLVETGNPPQLRALPRSTYRVETPARTAPKPATGKEG